MSAFMIAREEGRIYSEEVCCTGSGWIWNRGNEGYGRNEAGRREGRHIGEYFEGLSADEPPKSGTARTYECLRKRKQPNEKVGWSQFWKGRADAFWRRHVYGASGNYGYTA